MKAWVVARYVDRGAFFFLLNLKKKAQTKYRNSISHSELLIMYSLFASNQDPFYNYCIPAVGTARIAACCAAEIKKTTLLWRGSLFCILPTTDGWIRRQKPARSSSQSIPPNNKKPCIKQNDDDDEINSNQHPK